MGHCIGFILWLGMCIGLSFGFDLGLWLVVGGKGNLALSWFVLDDAFYLIYCIGER